MLEAVGAAAALAALSGSVGLLSGDAEIRGIARQPVEFDPDRSRTLTFGPARQAAQVTGVAVFRDGERLVSQPLEQPRALLAGQRLVVTVTASVIA